MLNYVKNFIKENRLENKKILIGLSGGIDSAVLADILSKINNTEIVCIHLNHNWRGECSKRDEEFSKNFAKKRGLAFYSKTLDENNKHTETAARESRYDFFYHTKEKFKADAVFLAHNKNDNIETLIYRLCKGTGPKGLLSIPKIRDFYFRPLLDFSRKEIEEYAKENGVEFVQDASNSDIKHKRNLIRNEIMPLLEKINEKTADSISNFIKINTMNQKIVDTAVKKACEKIFEGDKIVKSKFLSLEIELRYEILNRFLQDVLKNRDFKTIDSIMKFIEENNSSKVSVNKNVFLKIYNNKIYLLKNEKKEDVKEILLKEGKNEFDNYTIEIIKSVPPFSFPSAIEQVQYFNLNFELPYKVRYKREGDYIVPFSLKSKQKLKTVFIKKKIPSEKRSQIPLITLDKEVLYAYKTMVSEKLRVDKNEKNCYKVIIKEN